MQHKLKLLLISLAFSWSEILFAGDVPSSPLPPALMYNKQPLEAYCLYNILQNTSLKSPLNIKQCQIPKKDIKKKINNYYVKEGFYGYDYDYPDEDFTAHESCHWKYVASPFPGQFLIYAIWSEGGSGTFTDLVLVKRKGDLLWVEKKIDGGDRAAGGISEPTFKKGKLTYKKSMTSAALFSLGLDLLKKDKESAALIDNKPDELQDCMTCYAAAVTIESDLKDKKYLKVTLIPSPKKEEASETPPEKSLQTCFDRTVAKYNSNNKSELTLEEFKKFIMEVLDLYSHDGDASRASKP